jgi:alpha-mannosidase
VPAGAGVLVPGEQGDLVRSVVWRAAAPGTDGIETELLLVEGLDRVEIVTRIDKRLVYDPEAVLYRFAFALEPREVRVSVPGGSFAVETEQLPGANRNYLNARSWVELAGVDGPPGLTFVTLDVPMLQVGRIGTDAIVTGWWRHTAPSGTLWSYVMNNYWETNYRAGQEGRMEARYVVLPGGNPEAAAAFVTRPLIVVQ